MTFETATGLLVNTRTGKVHRPECMNLNQLSTAGMRWYTEWRGVAQSTTDTACRTCLPNGLPEAPHV